MYHQTRYKHLNVINLNIFGQDQELWIIKFSLFSFRFFPNVIMMINKEQLADI